MDGAALVGRTTGNDGFVDIRVNRDFFAAIGGCPHKIWPARLQIYGHADQMPAAGFGVPNEALQLQIGFLCYALVLHPNIQAKRARRLAGLPPFNDADQEVWSDFQALALRPFGWREVWIGYDPAKGTQNGDSAGCVVMAPPIVPGGKFRILERHQWRGMDFRAQADAIKQLTQQYNVTYIGIDSTGVGHGVYENVKAFFPAVREFVYNPNVKNALVLKAYDIISHRRLEFDAGHTDIAQSFLAIRRATTASGNRPTYEASRSEEASHADLAWATMHALFNEPLQGEAANTSNIVEIF